ncbi:MAG: hypothetical protein JNL74_22740, partial [Fibrobacteres bacterium]|nr:hypothetical protein [Fibrobacterota bacterium]
LLINEDDDDIKHNTLSIIDGILWIHISSHHANEFDEVDAESVLRLFSELKTYLVTKPSPKLTQRLNQFKKIQAFNYLLFVAGLICLFLPLDYLINIRSDRFNTLTLSLFATIFIVLMSLVVLKRIFNDTPFIALLVREIIWVGGTGIFMLIYSLAYYINIDSNLPPIAINHYEVCKKYTIIKNSGKSSSCKYVLELQSSDSVCRFKTEPLIEIYNKADEGSIVIETLHHGTFGDRWRNYSVITNKR